MSRGSGKIERRIGELFAATKDRALSVGELASHAFELPSGVLPDRKQRLSATRAAHRLLRRAPKTTRAVEALVDRVFAETTAKLGRPPERTCIEWDRTVVVGRSRRYRGMDQTFYKAMQTAPSWPVVDIVVRDWRATETKDRRLWFRPGRQRVGAMLTPPASPLVGPMTYSPAELDAFWDAHLSRETCGGDSRWIGKRRLAGILDVLAKLGAADPRYAARYGEAAALATRVRRLDGEQMNALRRAAEEHWKARQAERDRQPDVVSSLATPP